MPDTTTPLTDERLAAIRSRAAEAFRWVGAGQERLPLSVREHFTNDMPLLLAELDRVTAELANANAKLAAVLARVGPVTITRGQMTPGGPAHAAPALALLMRYTTPAAPVPAPVDVRHVASRWGGRHCQGCGKPWPCPIEEAGRAGEAVAERAKAAALATVVSVEEHCCGCDTEYDMYCNCTCHGFKPLMAAPVPAPAATAPALPQADGPDRQDGASRG